VFGRRWQTETVVATDAFTLLLVPGELSRSTFALNRATNAGGKDLKFLM
jgi:hypothetical protein